MAEPEVSVIIPVYNGEKYIEAALDSAFAQNVPLEVIVIDDASTDRTVEKVRPYRERENFIFLQNERNEGVGRSRNKGVAAARGRYIAFLDADDWWERGKLKKQIKILEESGCVLCTTGRELMTPDGSTTGRYIPVHERISYRQLLRHNSINCSSVLLKREIALEFPMEHDDSHEDYITWLRILNKYGLAAGIDQPFLKYRLSEGGKSRSKLKSARMTYRVYRYIGCSRLQSFFCFASYAIHGIWKYL
ncbi:MAG: glycosyltransferase family 2 protein [Blautia sp.]|nr:glycosyltransferase family 2 protein [Blautia sp.]